MDHKDLIPVTVQVTFLLPEKASIQRWGDIIRYYLTKYSEYLCNKKSVYIGHIKAFYSGTKNSFIKVNIFKREIPADILVKGYADVDNITLTVNSLVYGVTEEETVAALQYVSEEIEKQFMIRSNYVLKKPILDSKHCDHSHLNS